MADAKRLKVTFPTRDLINMTKQAQLALANEMQEILKVVGENLLAKVRRTYVDKGRGEKGEDGITWQPIQLRSLLARMRRSGHLVSPGRKDHPLTTGVLTRGTSRFQKVRKADAANSIVLRQAVHAGLLKVLSGGLTNDKDGKPVYKKGTLFGVVKHRRSGRTADSLKQRISPQGGGYAIGQDTGRQLDTLAPGANGNAGPSLKYDNDTVTVAATMNYSPYFDKLRPIMPESILPRWLDELEELVEEHGAKVIESALKEIP